ncbi:hypothetical protein HRH25_07505 [Flavisolibacter sp. BT320]|nr:hypothetical protein [Flavisolibacter longurius]
MKQLLLILCVTLSPVILFAQDSTDKEFKTLLKNKIFFTGTDPVEITLVSDFRRIKNKRQKKVYQPATVTFTMPGFPPVTEEIQLAARGEFRRTTCVMPSLSLDFKNQKAPKLSGLKRLKLVCGCSQSKYDEELLLKEFLIYKMYNMLTEMSFGVRLTKMTYKDAQNKMKEYSQYGFLIEDVDAVAKRNNSREYEKKVMNGTMTDRSQMTLVSMFQYMIGNTDWSLPNNHNIRYVQLLTDTISFPYVIPYDFDYCGLVNAPYAIPQQEFAIERVTDRYYRGVPRDKEEIAEAIKLFKDKKEFIYALVNGFDLLSKKVRDEMLRYLDSFYDDLDDKRKITYVFEKAVDKN